jgi:hypothetical protein
LAMNLSDPYQMGVTDLNEPFVGVRKIAKSDY